MAISSHYNADQAPLQVSGRSLAGNVGARPRIALTLVLVAAAMPVRTFQSVPVVNSASILDLLLVLVGATLFLDLAFRPVDTGYRELFWLLCIPLVVTIISLAWSEDPNFTLRACLVYAEGLVAYLFVIRELAGLSPTRIVTYIKRYTYLVIIPAVLLLFHVPGFEPPTSSEPLSGSYTTYFARLSHPVLGASNNLATILAFFVPILVYWGHTRRDGRFSRAGWVAFAAICATLSRGVLLAFVIAGLLSTVLVRRRPGSGARGLGGKIVAAVAIGGLAIGVFYAVNAPTKAFFQDRLSAANVEERTDSYAYAFSEIAREPLLGHGGGVTRTVPLAEETTSTLVLDPFDPTPATNPDERRIRVDVHNTYLQQAVYYGLPLGLVISLVLCGIPGVFLVRRQTALAGVIAYTLMVQLVSFLFESSFEGTVLRVLFYMSLGLATALLRAVEAEVPASTRRRW